MMFTPYGSSLHREIFLAQRRRKFFRRAWAIVGAMYVALFLAGYLTGYFS